jgi:hypothetical protein
MTYYAIPTLKVNKIQDSMYHFHVSYVLYYLVDLLQFMCAMLIMPDTSTGNKIAPIECEKNVAHRDIPIYQNSTFEFKSRIIDGTFTRGYCMQIIRGIVTLERPYNCS